jgi:hypothetical protein
MTLESPTDEMARSVTSGPSASDTPVDPRPLDDVMLAMDVVDTLRRRERLVERELDEREREDDLKARLRKIYAAQGIEVSDAIIEQGVAALKEGRFTYTPPRRSFGTWLASLYVTRGRWGKWVGAVAAMVVLAAILHHVAFVMPEQALPERLARTHAETTVLARTDAARQTLDGYLDAGQAALQAGDLDATRRALAQLDAARALLAQEYVLRIVNRPGERSGVWRIPDLNTAAKNYYILVEAVDPSGRLLRLPIQSEETREIETVDTWGLRVDESTFNAIARDKQDDGIIERDRFGAKSRGTLTPVYEIPTTGGAITRW